MPPEGPKFTTDCIAGLRRVADVEDIVYAFLCPGDIYRLKKADMLLPWIEPIIEPEEIHPTPVGGATTSSAAESSSALQPFSAASNNVGSAAGENESAIHSSEVCPGSDSETDGGLVVEVAGIKAQDKDAPEPTVEQHGLTGTDVQNNVR